jgi:hypothetical protein
MARAQKVTSYEKFFEVVRRFVRDHAGEPDAVAVEVRITYRVGGEARDQLVYSILPCVAYGPAPGGRGAEPFVPTPLQAAILAALMRRALRTDALARACSVSSSRLFAPSGGIKELRKRGLVRHHRRLGFYRPNAPPDALAK